VSDLQPASLLALDDDLAVRRAQFDLANVASGRVGLFCLIGIISIRAVQVALLRQRERVGRRSATRPPWGGRFARRAVVCSRSHYAAQRLADAYILIQPQQTAAQCSA
jgi:hypothetical protein